MAISANELPQSPGRKAARKRRRGPRRGDEEPLQIQRTAPERTGVWGDGPEAGPI